MAHKIAVIGAGIAGLATACYARMNGYEAEVFELHDKPGGLCTTWKRKGYTVDGCLHWLVGSGPAARGLHDCWRELGVLDGRQWIDHEVYMEVRAKSGKVFKLYTDLDRLEAHMITLAPADKKTIAEFIGLCRKLAATDLPPLKAKELRTFIDKITGLKAIMPMAAPFMKYGKVSVRKFAKKFSDPFLREAFAVPFDLPDFPLIAYAFTLAWMHNKTAAYPVGGSLPLARDMERRLVDLGGAVRYKARVKEILVENDKAVGVRLEDGTEQRADTVISAADGRAAIFEMLGGRYVDDEIRGYYESLPRFRPLIQASFGIDRDLGDQPGFEAIELDEPAVIGGEELRWVPIHNYSYDPTAAPEGKSTVVIRFMVDYDLWKGLAADRERYDAAKEEVANALIGVLERRWPGVSEQIEMIDVATPMTFERYTGNWEGSMEGWLITTKSMTMKMKKTLPGLDRFYMVGQWVSPGGGLPGCAITAKEVMQIVCHRDGKMFETAAA